MKNFTKCALAVVLAFFMFAGSAIAQNRALEGDVSVDPGAYTPGATVDLEFTWDFSSPDGEWANGAKLTFPEGVTINSQTSFEGVSSISGNSCELELNYSNENEVMWGAGSNDNSLGFFYHAAFPITTTVNVTVDADFEGEFAVVWNLYGEEWGATPHNLTGTIQMPMDNAPVSASAVVGANATSASPYFTISWEAAPEGADSYKVYKDAGEGFVEIATTDVLSYDDYAITETVEYQYAVSAVLNDSESLKRETETIFFLYDGTMSLNPVDYTFPVVSMLLDGTILDPAENAEFTITNIGLDDLVISDIYLFSQNAEDFSIISAVDFATEDVTIAGGATFEFEVKFDPETVGPKATLLSIDAGLISTFNIYGGAKQIPEGDVVEDPFALGVFSQPIGSIEVEEIDFTVLNDDYEQVEGVDGVFTLTTEVDADVVISDEVNASAVVFYDATAGVATGNEINLEETLPAGEYLILVAGTDEVSFNINFQTAAEYVITPGAVELGYVPIDCWHRGGSFIVSNAGGYSYTVEGFEVSDLEDVFEYKVTPEEHPVTVEWDSEIEYNFHLDADEAGSYEAYLILDHEDESKVYPVTGIAYTPEDGDVFEHPYNVAFIDGDYAHSADLSLMKNNYDVAGAATADVVYRFEYATDVMVDFDFTNEFTFDLYRAEDLQNTAPTYVTPILTEADEVTGVTVTAGVYYVILTGDVNAAYDFSITGEDLPVPAEFALLTPADENDNISINPVLTWEESTNAVSYNLYLGTTYPPALYASDLTSTEFTVENDLMPANVYFWYVEGVNTQGVATTETWGFTTELPTPKLVTATIEDFTNVLVTWQNPFETVVNVTEDFEGEAFPPVGWSESSNSTASTGGWTASDDNGSENFDIPSHTVYASTNDDAAGDDGSVDFLMMPETDLSAYDEVVLNFSTFFPGTFNQTAHILITNDNGETTEEVAVIEAAGSWHNVSVDLSDYATADYNTARIIFHSNDNEGSGSGWAIDDVELELINNYGIGGAVLGYNVYSNGEQVNTEILEDLSLLVEDLTADTYIFCVTAVYPEGESATACADALEILGRSKISGAVYNADGTVIEGAELTLVGEGVDPVMTTSDVDGKYEFANIPVLAGGYDVTCEASGWSSVTVEDLNPIEGTPIVQDFHLADIPYAVGEVVAEVVTQDEENRIFWGEGVSGEPLELSQYDAEAGNAYYQTFGSAYGVVYDLSDYSDATLSMVDFNHASYDVSGIWDYKIHVVNWDTKESVAELGPFQTTGDDKWEVEIPLGDVAGLGGLNVGIFMEPMGNAADDAYPDMTTDNNEMGGLSVKTTVGDWADFTESTIGDFLMDLWIITAEDSAPVMAKKIQLSGANETENTRLPSGFVSSEYSIFSQKAIAHSVDTKSFQKFLVYVLPLGSEGDTEEWTEIGETTDMEIIDNTVWQGLPQGLYRYAVVSKYTLNESAPVFSNVMGKDMLYEAMVLVSTNTGEPATDAIVTITNEFGETFTSSVENEAAHFNDPLIRKGQTTITATMDCYENAVWTGTVWDDDYFIVELVLEETLSPAANATASVDCSDITLNWTPGSDCGNVVNYTVLKDGDVVAEEITETTYVEEGLAGGSYTYEVIANYVTGHATAVEVVVEVMEILPVTGLVVEQSSWNNVTLEWDPIVSDDFIAYAVHAHHNITGETTVVAESLQEPGFVHFDMPVAVGVENVFTYTVVASYIGACDASSESVEVVFDAAVDAAKAAVNVYPNPATDVVNVELPAGVESVKVLNTVGQVVYSANAAGESLLAINAKSFANGAYLIQIVKANGEVMNAKVVVTK
jgi:hypothetical protein